jgi:hypothetical protein
LNAVLMSPEVLVEYPNLFSRVEIVVTWLALRTK